MQGTDNRIHVKYQEFPPVQTTFLTNAFTLITSVAISVLLGLGSAFASSLVLTASFELVVVAQVSAVLGAIVGIIICLSRRKYFPKPPQKNSKPAPMPLSPVKGHLAGIKLSTIHKLKLMSTPSTPSKRYRCMIVYKNGKQEIYMFTPNVYNVFLKVLPPHKKDI